MGPVVTQPDLGAVGTIDRPPRSGTGRHVRARSAPSLLRRIATQLGIIVLFCVPAVVLWWHAWSGGAASTVRCSCLDPGQQVWFVAWPAYALLHGLSIFSTTWLWPSHGVNLLSNASSPLVGVVLAPVTWLFGPFVATTVALTLAPGLSAWGCWLACRRLVAWSPACWIAGFVFGYSPFVIENVDQGHLGLALLVVPPLILVVLHEILVRRQRSALSCGIALGLLLFAQFLISQEILALTVMTATLGIALCALAAPRHAAAAFPFAVRAFAVAAVVAGVTLAYPVWFMLTGPETIKGSIWSGQQVLFVARAYQLWNAGLYDMHLTSFPIGTGQGPPPEFLGVAVLVAAAAALLVSWRRRTAWVLALVAVVATACSWGAAVWLSPNHLDFVKWLPWQWVTNDAILDNVEAVHFAALADLAVAVILALGIGAAHSWSFWSKVPAAVRLVGVVLLGAVVAALLVPQWRTYEAPLTVEKVRLPPWFRTVAPTVAAGSVVASYPFPASAALESEPMVWQAADGMRFRLAGGYVKIPGKGHGVLGTGPPGSATWTMDALTSTTAASAAQFTLTAQELLKLRAALRRWDVSYIVVTDTGPAPVEAAAVFTAATGTTPTISYRAWTWDLRASPAPFPDNAASAAATFSSCRSFTRSLGVVRSGTALPQTLNTCIATAPGTGTGTGA
jgi:hypothetical protein